MPICCNDTRFVVFTHMCKIWRRSTLRWSLNLSLVVAKYVTWIFDRYGKYSSDLMCVLAVCSLFWIACNYVVTTNLCYRSCTTWHIFLREAGRGSFSRHLGGCVWSYAVQPSCLTRILSTTWGGGETILQFDVLMCYELVDMFSSSMECFCLVIGNFQ